MSSLNLLSCEQELSKIILGLALLQPFETKAIILA